MMRLHELAVKTALHNQLKVDLADHFGDRRAKPGTMPKVWRHSIVVSRLSIAKQLQCYCMGRAFGAGVGLMIGHFI